jgi:predicted transglutaminase-like cysteine proteinase
VKNKLLAICILSALGTVSAFAQTDANALQRSVNQQTRIENGLKDGQLTTKEAGRLEKEQGRIDQLEAKDLKDGKLTARERAQLHRAQNRASQDIKAADNNRAKGNPESL